MSETSVVFIRTEQQCWDDIKDALDRIDTKTAQIDDDWVLVGTRLIEIRSQHPGFKGGVFNAAVKRQGIDLTPHQISAAQWWSGLSPEQRSTLRADHPGVLMPTSMRQYCLDTHPDWTKTEKFRTRKSFTSKENRQKPALALDLLGVDGEPEAPKPAEPKLTPYQKKKAHDQAVAQLAAEELKELRKRKKAAREAKAAGDDRPALKKPQPGVTVVMYGVQLWPIPESEVSAYDYDQLYFAIAFWRGTLELIRHIYKDGDCNLAVRLRERMKPMRLYVDHRFTADKSEAIGWITLVQRLADHFHDNPDGDCRLPPLDPVMR